MSGLEIFEDYQTKFEKASIGRRIVSFIIDYFTFYLSLVVINFIFNNQEVNFTSIDLEGFPALISFCLLFFLWPISEGLWGQTVGKRFMDIKVVTKNNLKINFGQAFGRFFLGFIDCSFISGIIVAIINEDNQRIGDMAAGTLVVKSEYGV